MENNKIGILKKIVGSISGSGIGSKVKKGIAGLKELKVKHSIKIKFNKDDTTGKKEENNQGSGESNQV